MIKDEAEMGRPEVCSKLMECNKEFLVNYILYLDEWMTKYQDALGKACEELEELERNTITSQLHSSIASLLVNGERRCSNES